MTKLEGLDDIDNLFSLPQTNPVKLKQEETGSYFCNVCDWYDGKRCTLPRPGQDIRRRALRRGWCVEGSVSGQSATFIYPGYIELEHSRRRYSRTELGDKELKRALANNDQVILLRLERPYR